MVKFYVMIEEGVEGPFEPYLLKYLSGFNEETLVSPDDLNAADWSRALNVPEIRPYLNLSQELLPPMAFPPNPNQTVRFIEVPSSERLIRDDKKPVNTDQELLEIMERFPDQLAPVEVPQASQSAAGATATTTAAVSSPSVNDVSTLMPPAQEKFIPKRPKKSKWLMASLFSLLLVMGAIGYMAFKMGMLEKWKDLAGSFLNSAPPAPVIEVPPPVPAVTLPPVEVKPTEPTKPVIANKSEKKADKKVSKKIKIAPKPQAKKENPAPPPKPVKEEPLKNQKFMMPGVPSPKMQEKPKQVEKPSVDAETQKLDDEYEMELKKARTQEESETKKKKKKPANEEDYFEFQWIGADPGEKN